jgi:hypothetical protein
MQRENNRSVIRERRDETMPPTAQMMDMNQL